MSDRLALFGFGCTIDSALPIVGALAARHRGTGSPELRIDVSVMATATLPSTEQFIRCGDTIRYIAPSVGQYDCTDRGIEVTPVTGADPAMLTNLLIANALPATLWLRGNFLLHSAVVHWPQQGAAFAICGPSGSGKSMLAAQWLDHGAQLVADDVLVLGRNGDLSTGSGLPGGIHLRRDGDGDGKRAFRALAPDQIMDSASLAAILILHRQPADQPARIERLAPVAAVEALLQNRHRPIVPALLGRHTVVLAQASDIAARTPILSWSRPDGATLLDSREREMIVNACARR